MYVQRKGFRPVLSCRAFSFDLGFPFMVTVAGVFIRTAPAGSKSVPAFGREVIVDNQRVTGEPSISIDGAGSNLSVNAVWFLNYRQFRMHRVHPVASCFADATLTRPPFAPARLQGLRHSYESVRPSVLRFGTLASRIWPLELLP